jgi:hypothetical protein
MPTITMTVHGNAFCSEQLVISPNPDVPVMVNSGSPHGWARTFGQVEWYHVAIPNITYFDGARMFLDKVLILMFRTNIRFDRADMGVASRFLSGLVRRQWIMSEPYYSGRGIKWTKNASEFRIRSLAASATLQTE